MHLTAATNRFIRVVELYQLFQLIRFNSSILACKVLHHRPPNYFHFYTTLTKEPSPVRLPPKLLSDPSVFIPLQHQSAIYLWSAGGEVAHLSINTRLERGMRANSGPQQGELT